MKKALLLCLFLLTAGYLVGCSGVGNKSAGISVIYLITAIISFTVIPCYFLLIKKTDPWSVLLFSSVFIVNTGYYILSVSKTLSIALWANRISYLGSSLLPLAMLMIILKVADKEKPRWLPYLLFVVAGVVFFVAATPGFSDIYYKEVSLESYNGATVLDKEYGPWHVLYLFYLLGYTAITAIVAVHTAIKRKLSTDIQTFVLISSVFINIGIWLLEQFVKIDFELLSVSYVMSELFFLCLFIMLQEENKSTAIVTQYANEDTSDNAATGSENKDALMIYKKGVARLTPAETTIYRFYLEGKTTKEIMSILTITENTLKYHNKNIYSKLGVSSRKELREIAKLIKE
ncbi:MAG: hypothetical protein IKL24_02795 [Clostridia bacterium]|nr:hypothetical protein [Clostridia bacterium]